MDLLVNGVKGGMPKEPESAPLAHTQRCHWCKNPFEHRQRTQSEAEWLRRALLVTAPLYDPIICDPCFRRSLNGVYLNNTVQDVPPLLRAG